MPQTHHWWGYPGIQGSQSRHSEANRENLGCHQVYVVWEKEDVDSPAEGLTTLPIQGLSASNWYWFMFFSLPPKFESETLYSLILGSAFILSGYAITAGELNTFEIQH
jgi:hypothetical protein